MKKTWLNSLSRFRVYIRLRSLEFRLDLVVPVVLLSYLLVHWLGR